MLFLHKTLSPHYPQLHSSKKKQSWLLIFFVDHLATFNLVSEVIIIILISHIFFTPPPLLRGRHTALIAGIGFVVRAVVMK